jgi:hypothetical protein
VIKASGEGLSRALHDFDVDVAPRILSIPGGRGETERWALADLPAPVGYLAAGAVSPGAEPPRWREL